MGTKENTHEKTQIEIYKVSQPPFILHTYRYALLKIKNMENNNK